MDVNLSGQGFGPQIARGDFIQYTFQLSEEVDLPVLEEAFRDAISDCPYFARTLVMENGRLCFAPHQPDCRVRPLVPADGMQEHKVQTPVVLTETTGRDRDGDAKEFETGFGSDMAYVRAGGKTLIVELAHAMTDGYGCNLLANLVLYHYFCRKDGIIYPFPKYFTPDGKIVVDEDSDLLADLVREYAAELSEEAGGPAVSPCFHLPESSGSAEKVNFLLSMDAAEFKRVMKETLALEDAVFDDYNRKLFPIGGLACVFLYMLMARNIQKICPDNQENIGCRFPVNTRSMYGKPNAIRNFSMPQAVLSLNPVELPGIRQGMTDGDGSPENAWSAEDTVRLAEQLLPQLQKKSINTQLAEIKDLIEGKRKEIGPDLAARFAQTMLVSNLGSLAWMPESGRVTQSRDVYGNFPCTLFLMRLGDRQLIGMLQTFSADRYRRGLVRELEAAGIKEVLTL